MSLNLDQQQEWFDALMEGSIEKLKTLLNQGANVNAKIQDQPGIILAANFEQIAAMRFLLESGAEIDATDEHGATALMWAAEGGRKDLVEFLLSNGANINAINKGGFTAVNAAKSHRSSPPHREIVRLLWEKGGRPGKARTVFVTGAGFSRAYFDNAPVMIDAFKVREELLPKYREFPAAREILESELKHQSEIDGNPDGDRINIERLMTRIAGGMPYDSAHNSEDIFGTLLSDIRRIFVQRIAQARQGSSRKAELNLLAEYCLRRKINIVTFNYDDLFDEALQNVAKRSPGAKGLEWTPSGGYGFYCRPSLSLIGLDNSTGFFGENTVQLLKLHGSMNWRLRRGASPPYSMDSFVHHEEWESQNRSTREQFGAAPVELYGLDKYEYNRKIEQHLENEPFIIPPILTKSDLVSQPILKLVWSQAYDLLYDADQVIFIGYSLPVTDIAAAYLFREACSGLYPTLPNIQVVDYAPNSQEKQNAVKAAYRNVFHNLPDECFSFDGALTWANEFIENDSAQLLGSL